MALDDQGVMGIHANWPAYPLEFGGRSLLMALASFPVGTAFRRIDDVDQCALFLAPAFGEYPDPYDERSFHVALWHEDLLEARDLGLLADDEVRLTSRGWEAVEEILAQTLYFPERAQPRMHALIEAQLYDTALRDISVVIESTMREACASDVFGARLVDAFIDHAGGTGKFPSSGLKAVRGEIRAAFRFMGNDHLLERPRAIALLSRMSQVLLEVDDIAATLARPTP